MSAPDVPTRQNPVSTNEPTVQVAQTAPDAPNTSGNHVKLSAAKPIRAKLSKKQKAELTKLAMTLYSHECEIEWNPLVAKKLQDEQKDRSYWLAARNALIKQSWEALDRKMQASYMKRAREEYGNRPPALESYGFNPCVCV